MRWFPRLQVATAPFSCSTPHPPPNLNFLDPYFIFMYVHYNHWHRTTAHLQLNILLYFNLQGVRSELKTFIVDSITTVEFITVITFVAETSEYVDKMWINLCKLWSTRWRSWLRHYATNRKVAGSISDGVIGIFH
jgi:hypothetical protein